MSVTDQITALTADKTAIESAITTKGGTLSQNCGFDTFAADIATIPSGDDLDKFFKGSLTNVVTNATSIADKKCLQDTRITSFIADKATSIGQYCFDECSNLAYFSGKKITNVNVGMFRKCGALSSVRLDSVISINIYGFRVCSNLSRLILPSIYSLEYANYAFQRCTNLKTFVLGKNNVCAIAGAAPFTETPFAQNGIGGVIYVDENLIQTYQSATNWSAYYAYGTCNFVPLAKKLFSADGTTTTFILEYNSQYPEEVFFVRVGNTVVDFTYDNTTGTLILANAPASGTNNIEIRFKGEVKTTFSGDGVTTTFTYQNGKPSEVYYVNVGTTTYAVGSNFDVTYDNSTGTITFATAPASGTDNIEVYSNEVTV